MLEAGAPPPATDVRSNSFSSVTSFAGGRTMTLAEEHGALLRRLPPVPDAVSGAAPDTAALIRRLEAGVKERDTLLKAERERSQRNMEALSKRLAESEQREEALHTDLLAAKQDQVALAAAHRRLEDYQRSSSASAEKLASLTDAEDLNQQKHTLLRESLEGERKRRIELEAELEAAYGEHERDREEHARTLAAVQSESEADKQDAAGSAGALEAQLATVRAESAAARAEAAAERQAKEKALGEAAQARTEAAQARAEAAAEQQAKQAALADAAAKHAEATRERAAGADAVAAARGSGEGTMLQLKAQHDAVVRRLEASASQKEAELTADATRRDAAHAAHLAEREAAFAAEAAAREAAHAAEAAAREAAHGAALEAALQARAADYAARRALFRGWTAYRALLARVRERRATRERKRLCAHVWIRCAKARAFATWKDVQRNATKRRCLVRVLNRVKNMGLWKAWNTWAVGTRHQLRLLAKDDSLGRFVHGHGSEIKAVAAGVASSEVELDGLLEALHGLESQRREERARLEAEVGALSDALRAKREACERLRVANAAVLAQFEAAEAEFLDATRRRADATPTTVVGRLVEAVFGLEPPADSEAVRAAVQLDGRGAPDERLAVVASGSVRHRTRYQPARASSTRRVDARRPSSGTARAASAERARGSALCARPPRAAVSPPRAAVSRPLAHNMRTAPRDKGAASAGYYAGYSDADVHVVRVREAARRRPSISTALESPLSTPTGSTL
jgi:hypothetical protein